MFHLNNAYNFFCTTFENVTLIDDFNMIPENKKLSGFCEMNKFEHVILKTISFKGLLPSKIDRLLTNHNETFLISDVYEAGISDHRKMIIAVLRKTFAKGKPKSVFPRCYKNFDQDSFNGTLNSRVSLPNFSFENFFEIFQSTLNFFATYKLTKFRYNSNPFMTMRLRKEIMIRSKLRNKFNKSRTCVNLYKSSKKGKAAVIEQFKF